MGQEKKKTSAEIKAERELMMAKAALKNALTSYSKKQRVIPPRELIEYWKTIGPEDWKHHLKLFEKELDKHKHPNIKALVHSLKNNIKDIKQMSPRFKRSPGELLLMMAIGQIDVEEFGMMAALVPSNREKLDRKIEMQIKKLDWQDDADLAYLDELTMKLENPRIKKTEIEKIDKEIDNIEKTIHARKSKRDALAIKLVEWKARGSIDIAAGEDGEDFRLEA